MKFSESFQKTVVFIGLLSLMVSAFFIRQENFIRSEARSIDEVVYFTLGQQVKDDLSNYNSIPYGTQLAEAGRPLPDYFFKPLFKHPPLYALFSAFAMTLMNNDFLAAFYVSLIFGVLLIPLTYFLGHLVSNRLIGFVAATMVAWDPIITVCSQKIWMETPIAFFVLAAVYFMVKSLKSEQYAYLILAGICSGLGALFKYTGGIATLALCVYAVLYRRDLFRNTNFWLGLCMPILVLMPWFYWNFKVYGMEYLTMQIELHSNTRHFSSLIKKGLAYSIILAAGFMLIKKVRADIEEVPAEKRADYVLKIKKWLKCGVAVIFAFLLRHELIQTFTVSHLPQTSWSGHTFYGSPAYFYIGRMLEFSLLYLMAMVSYFVLLQENKEIKFLKVTSVVILLFFMLWGAFQSRYIMSCLPLLCIVGSHFLYLVYCRFEDSNFIVRLLARSGVVIIGILMFCKIYYINIMVSFPNDLCYF